MNKEAKPPTDPRAPHPLLTRPPNCLDCGSRTDRHITVYSNANGNAHRPYYKCGKCRAFACFGDLRGIHPSNPACGCGLRSRFQVGMHGGSYPGALHWRCAVGGCGFFQYHRGEEGEVLCFPPRRYGAEEMIGMGL